MSDNPTIWKMAEAHYSAAYLPGEPPWRDLLDVEKDTQYDAMWEALRVLREPPRDALEAALAADWSSYPLGESHATLWRTMIDKLLEVK